MVKIGVSYFQTTHRFHVQDQLDRPEENSTSRMYPLSDATVVAVVVVVLITLHTVDATGQLIDDFNEIPVSQIFLSVLGCSSHLAGGSLLLDRMESDIEWQKKEVICHWERSAAELYHFFDIQFSICFGSIPNFAAWSSQLPWSFFSFCLRWYLSIFSQTMTAWWFGTFGLFFHSVGNDHPNWRTPSFFRGVLTCFNHQPDDYRKLVPNIFAAKNSMSKSLWFISLPPKPMDEVPIFLWGFGGWLLGEKHKAELQHQREVFELRRRQAGKNWLTKIHVSILVRHHGADFLRNLRWSIVDLRWSIDFNRWSESKIFVISGEFQRLFSQDYERIGWNSIIGAGYADD